MYTFRVPSPQFVHAAIQAGQLAGFRGAVLLLARAAHRSVAQDWISSWSDIDDITANDVLVLSIGFTRTGAGLQADRRSGGGMVNVVADDLVAKCRWKDEFSTTLGTGLADLLAHAEPEPYYNPPSDNPISAIDSHGITDIRRYLGIAEQQLPALLIISYPTRTEHLVELAINPAVMPSEIVRRVAGGLDDVPQRYAAAELEMTNLPSLWNNPLKRTRRQRARSIEDAQRRLDAHQQERSALADRILRSLQHAPEEIKSLGSDVASWVREERAADDVMLRRASEVISFLESRSMRPCGRLVSAIRTFVSNSQRQTRKPGDEKLRHLLSVWRTQLADIERELEALELRHARARAERDDLATRLDSCLEIATMNTLAGLGFTQRGQLLEPSTSRLRTTYRHDARMVPGGASVKSTFISYGGPDSDFAQKLNDALLENGVTTFFFPKDAVPGRKLHRMMREGVNQHDRVILICSRASLDRPGVLNEITETLQREARDGGKEYLIPITLDDYVFSGWRPDDPGLAQAVKDRVVADFRGADRDPVKFNNRLLCLITALER
ncbi:TIR domain-containing protein [Sorangium sp. So ce341]|uniref:toll/interleukin-1 receptor domain-containing protein n=1 Tax=Sorangium sp. So ce341 TaxID=3133302 RepID=UPI003F637327